MNKNVRSNTVKKCVANTRTVEPVGAPGADTAELKTSLAKALCRQHIMWPSDGPLVCERGEACDKQSQCVELAESVLDYRRDRAAILKSKLLG